MSAGMQLEFIRLRSATGAATVDQVKLFDASGAVIWGGDLSKTLTLSTTFAALSDLVGAEWATLRAHVYGLHGTVAGNIVEVSFGVASGQVGGHLARSVGTVLAIGSVPEEIAGGTTATLTGSVAATLANLERVEDSAHASGDRGIMFLGVRNDSPGSLVNAPGDYAPFQITAAGRARMASAYETMALASGTISATNDAVTVANATGMLSGSVQLSTVTSTGPTVLVEYSLDGSNWSPARWVAQGGSPSTTWSAVTLASTFAPRSFVVPPGAVAVRGRMTGGAAGPHTLQLALSSAPFQEFPLINGGSMQIAGSVAHGSAVSGNPVLAAIEGRSTDPVAVSSGQAARATGSLLGKSLVLPYALPGQSVDGVGTMTNTSDTSILAAQGAGVRSYLTTIVIANETGTNLIVAIKDGTTIKQRVPVPANGGAVINLPVPLRGSANTAWNFACLSSPGGNVYGSVVGFTAAE